MPIIVNREERRAAVVAIAFDLAADRGIDALTLREIAAAAGCSSSIVSHYFRNKNELLFEVYKVANTRARERLRAAFAAGRPLIDCFAEILPIGAQSQRNWRVWMAFWGRAHAEPAYLAERRHAAEESLALYRAMIEERGGGDGGFAARRLIATIAGVSLEACFAPADWGEAEMRAVLAAELADLGLDPAADARPV